MSEVKESTYGKITDEAVAEVRRRLHKVYPIEEPFVRYVNADSIRHAARAIGDMNPLWIDPGARQGSAATAAAWRLRRCCTA